MFQVKESDKVIGTTKLEYGDPPMGFAHGEFFPLEGFSSRTNHKELTVICNKTKQKICCSSVVIEVYEELNETQITIQVESSEEYEKYFSHHSETYEKQFS